jgi:hypothetical protein
MRRRFVVAVALLVGSFGTGCPETYGKNGYLDDAISEDLEEERRQKVEEQNTLLGKCPDGKPPRDICEGGICYRGCP